MDYLELKDFSIFLEFTCILMNFGILSNFVIFLEFSPNPHRHPLSGTIIGFVGTSAGTNLFQEYSDPDLRYLT